MEIYATNVQPEGQLASIKLFAKDLVLLLAFHLAERIASLLPGVGLLHEGAPPYLSRTPQHSPTCSA